MNQEYILIDLQPQASRQNDAPMWILTFQRISDNLVFEMTVDSTYRNFTKKGWNHVVTSESPWAVYANLKLTTRHTRQGTPVVSADSTADIIYRCADQAEALELAQASVDHNSPGDRFRGLFE